MNCIIIRDKTDFLIFAGSYLDNSLKKGDRRLDKYIGIIDTQGISTDNLNLDFTKNMLPIFLKIFPDILYAGYIVNVNMIFKWFYNIISAYLHENTKKKVKIIGSNLSEIKNEVSERIPSKILPKYLGGDNDMVL